MTDNDPVTAPTPRRRLRRLFAAFPIRRTVLRSPRPTGVMILVAMAIVALAALVLGVAAAEVFNAYTSRLMDLIL